MKDDILLKNQLFKIDSHSNITPKIIDLMERNLLHQPYNPLYLLKNRIKNYFYQTFVDYKKSPLFSLHDNLNSIVTPDENFDSLLIPANHPSRRINESYYINSQYMLRTHTSSHQIPLIKCGLNNFLVAGDVYRRDSIDSHHYPVFHQMEGVRLYTANELYQSNQDVDFTIFAENQKCNPDHQQIHNLKATKLTEFYLKSTLEGLMKYLFKKDIEMKWVSAYFPFTHPSWELEVNFNGKFIEMLGCGIMNHEILVKGGVSNRIGWAFGLGLERIAMLLYDIPDIRLFWSRDTGFLNQFKTDDCEKDIKMKMISKYPQCVNDISFWLPESDTTISSAKSKSTKVFEVNDFYELVRNVTHLDEKEVDDEFDSVAISGTDQIINQPIKNNRDNLDLVSTQSSSLPTIHSSGSIDIVEQVHLIDEYIHPRDGRRSFCFRIIYRHPLKTLTKGLVNKYHSLIEQALVAEYGVTIR